MSILTTSLTSLQVASPLSYLIAFAFPLFDAVMPLVPSESLIIALGVATAGSTDPRIFLLLLCAVGGAFFGDNLSYWIGWRFGPWARQRFFRGEKGAARLAWAERSLARYGMGIIIVCRFIPGGRTAVTLTCGLVRYDYRRFLIATAIAAVLWACYAFFAGRIGGKAFEDQPIVGFAVAAGGAVVVSALVELARRGIGWQRARLRAARGERAAEPGDDQSPGQQDAGFSGR